MKCINLTRFSSNQCFVLSDVCCWDKIRCFLWHRSPLTILPTSAKGMFCQDNTLHYGFACIALIQYSGILLHHKGMFSPPLLAKHFCPCVTPAPHECADRLGVCWPVSSLTEQKERGFCSTSNTPHDGQINNHSFSHNTTHFSLFL